MRKAVLILTVLMMTIAGCGEIVWFPEPDPNAPDSVTVAADPDSTIINSEVIITATVNKADGDPVPDGTTVFFSTSGGGSLSPSSATTTDGEATVILTGPSTPGNVTVTATAGGISGNFLVKFLPLVSVSADPTIISTASGGPSTITATVKKADGTANIGATVVFSTTTTGVTLTPSSTNTDNSGNAIATLNVDPGVLPSGTIITITATQQGTTNSGTAKVSITQ